MKKSHCFIFCTIISIILFADAQNFITIDGNKDTFYENLTLPEEGYLFIPSTDFIPLNGHKPDDNRDCSASVWLAWDSTYLYVYAEVSDDKIHVNQIQRWFNDCIEIKFDPFPTPNHTYSVVNARFSALDSAQAANVRGVDNLYSEGYLDSTAAFPANHARRITDSGYALEFRLAWRWIKTEEERIQPEIGTMFGLSISFHDNDGATRESTIQWSTGMADEVYILTPLLATAELLPDHRIKLLRKNMIDPDAFPGKTYINSERLGKMENQGFNIENWRYHPGDDSLWRESGFDDADWEIAPSQMEWDQASLTGWQGIGWFRAYIEVDSAVLSKPLGFSILQAGASEIYLNGKLLYRFGNVSATRETEQTFLEQSPKSIVFNRQPVNILAIRYSNVSVDFPEDLRILQGFEVTIWKDIDQVVETRIDTIRTVSIYQMIMTVVPLTLAVIHLLIFAFSPKLKENLFFALCMIGWAIISFFNYYGPFLSDLPFMLSISIIEPFYVSLALIFGLLTAYATAYPKLPRFYPIFIFAALVPSVWAVIQPGYRLVQIIFNLYIGVIAIELFRVIIIKNFRQKKERWISGIGFVILMLTVVYQILSTMRIVPPIGQYGIIYIYGVLFLSICFSIDLSLDFARTNKKLEHQLNQVQELSQKTLEHERRAKEEEITRKLLEADNARKTRELEEARNLQLSMLPREIPTLPHLEIKAYMKTATEVGGDYYDFKISKDGRLLIAIGDATGHGMKAGTMVGITKGLFNSLDDISDLINFFNRSTDVIRRMNLGNLYMALSLAIVEDHRFTLASAGMPPVLIFRHQSKKLETIELKGMPLGAHADFPYQQEEVQLHPHDTLLMMSDGFPELFNEQKEIFDYTQVSHVFSEVAEKSPQQIINHLEQTAKSWQKSQPQNDDITFIVLKVR
jgi:serine phosphatase RsbU (regulator of sigma subunit)